MFFEERGRETERERVGARVEARDWASREGIRLCVKVDRGFPASLMYSCGVQVQRCEDFKVGGHHEEQGRKNRTNVIPEGTESVFSDTFGQGRGGAREREAEREERIVKSLKDVKQNM